MLEFRTMSSGWRTIWRWTWVGSPGRVLKQELGGQIAKLVGGLPDGGEGHYPVGGEVDVVVADEGDVIGAP